MHTEFHGFGNRFQLGKGRVYETRLLVLPVNFLANQASWLCYLSWPLDFSQYDAPQIKPILETLLCILTCRCHDPALGGLLGITVLDCDFFPRSCLCDCPAHLNETKALWAMILPEPARPINPGTNPDCTKEWPTLITPYYQCKHGQWKLHSANTSITWKCVGSLALSVKLCRNVFTAFSWLCIQNGHDQELWQGELSDYGNCVDALTEGLMMLPGRVMGIRCPVAEGDCCTNCILSYYVTMVLEEAMAPHQ